ncbi:hypothetical protein BKA66DRAFT_408964 [Pyrenochaeta sp. MPI-SDFR-AT-0127]|nr:hypothetical protein BKA66DRAFT_408964 [Pyrenochaeta sp. MPI-SDFR-AT-0127]
MSRIACIWADLADDAAAEQWYEDKHIPDVISRLDTTARNAEQAEDNMFKEVAGIDGKYMTVYDLSEDKDAKDVDAQIYPKADALSADARFHARCYTECANWFGDEWRADVHDIQMWIVVRWQPVEAVHDQFVDWFRDEFAPGMLESPELLRMRIFQLENASTVKDQKHEQQDTSSLYRYLTFWEFDCDELPWEILVYLGSSDRWRYYVEGGHLNWQIRQYLVNRVYPEDDIANSPAVKRASIILNGASLRGIDHSDNESESDRGSVDDTSGSDGIHGLSTDDAYVSR